MEAIRETLEVTDGKVTLVLPDSFVSRRVEVIVLPAPETQTQVSAKSPRRRPSPLLAATVIVGDLMAPVLPESEWDALK